MLIPMKNLSPIYVLMTIVLCLIARNPVTGVCFFHFLIEMFIKHVLGIDTGHSGLYGEMSAYYGTVEQR